MQQRDFEKFCAMFDGAYEAKGRTLTANTKALFFQALRQYPLDVIGKALTAHLLDPEKGEWPPMPANIVAQINAAAGRDGRPTADEAWAISLRGLDEFDTIVWTEEMQQAFGVARSVLERRDTVGARRAFIEAYTRLVGEARAAGVPVKWMPSLGRDPGRREIELAKAADAGLLPPPEVAALLPAPVKAADVCPEGLAKVKALVATLVPASEKIAQRRAAQLEAERQAVAERKAKIAAAARQYAEDNEVIDRPEEHVTTPVRGAL